MSSARGVRIGFFAVVLLGAGVALGRFGTRWLEQARTLEARPDVITAVHELARLEGVSYHVERVVDLKDAQPRLFGLVPATDAILLVASGEVIAGVDLGKLRPEDVVVDAERRSASIRLPPAEVFSARLDNARTYVHTRQTDLLAQRKESLETQARKAAEQTLQAAAEDAGIQQRAAESVARTVRSLVRSLGYTDVRVEVRPGA